MRRSIMGTRARLALWAIALLLTACGTKDIVTPADTIDSYTGTTWVRYGFKGPATGKDIYYYLTFQKNSRIDRYVMYDKIERSPDDSELATYSAIGAGTYPGSTNLTIAFKSGPVTAEVFGAKLTLKFASGDQVYLKE